MLCIDGKCKHYRLIRKDNGYKGFCDYFGDFFYELKPDTLKERTKECDGGYQKTSHNKR